MNKQECNFTTAVSEHLSERPTSQDELSYEAGNTNSKTHWCEPVRQEHEKGYTLWASCDPYHKICNGGGIPDKNLKHYWKSTNDDDRIGLEWEGLSCPTGLGGQTREKTITKEQEDLEKYGETKTRAIIGAMINKLLEEWFLRVSKDKDDLEGIIDYLEPTLYNGFIDHNDEAYKRRRNKLLGMPYIEPPPIVKEEAKITGYNLGAGEKEDICTKWASCNPHFDECDGGDNPRKNKEYWESSNDDKRTNLEWENLSFDNWVKVAFGKNAEAMRKLSRPARPIIMCRSETKTRPLGPPSGLKGLLHMLNATVIPTKGIKSLWKDGDNLKDYYIKYDQKQCSREFLALSLLEGKQKLSGGIFDNIKYLILFSVKRKYMARNTGNGQENEENTDSYETLRRNLYDSSFGGVEGYRLGLGDSWGIITVSWIPCPSDLRGIEIAGSIGQTSITKSVFGLTVALFLGLLSGS
ncbi:hypothetical protein Tco_0357274 [Tanacetum coccineum]